MKKRPAVEEAGQRAEGFAQVDVLAAGLGHGGGEFAVAERGDEGEDGGDEPGGDEEPGGLHLACDVGGDDEDAAADHGAHDQRGGVEEAEAFYKLSHCCMRFRMEGLSRPAERRSAMTAMVSAPAAQTEGRFRG